MSSTPAETYESFMVPFRFRPWAEILLDHAELTPATRMLDLACGTGIVARLAAQRIGAGGSVSGVDMNPAMIDVARAAAEKEGLAIDWQVGTADALPYSDESFDLVTVQQGLQFFPDQIAALHECLRVLVPGGLLVVSIWSSVEKQGIQQAYAAAIEQVTGVASMNTPYGTVTEVSLHTLLQQGGFTEISIDEITIPVTFDAPNAWVGLMVEGTSAGVPAMRGRSDSERAALSAAVADEMKDALNAVTVDGQLRTKSTSFLAMGSRAPQRHG